MVGIPCWVISASMRRWLKAGSARRLDWPSNERVSSRAPRLRSNGGRVSNCRLAAAKSWPSARAPLRPWLSMRSWAWRRSRSQRVRAAGPKPCSQRSSAGVRSRGPTCWGPLSICCCSWLKLASSRRCNAKLDGGSTTCTVVRGSNCRRRSSRAVLSTTVAALGARAVNGAGLPGLMLGSTSQGQLESRATNTPTSNTEKVSCGRHTSGS